MHTEKHAETSWVTYLQPQHEYYDKKIKKQPSVTPLFRAVEISMKTGKRAG
jgi:hypothetical protein